MSRQFFSGNSIEQAVMAAARHHGVEPERIAYTTRDKKHGFLNIRRRVVIEVDPEKPELTEDEMSRRVQGASAPPTSKPKIVDVPEEVTPKEREELAGPPADEYDEGESSDDSYDDDSDDDSDDEEYESDEDSEDDAEEDEPADDSEEESPRGRGGRGSRGGRGRQSGKKQSGDRGDRSDRSDRGERSDRSRERRSRRRDSDDDNVRMYRGVKVDWKDEVELEGVSRELAAFEFAVEQTLDVMDLEIEYTIVEGDTFKIEFSGEDADLLTEDDGRVLKAFEHVLPRIVRGLVGDTHNCKVDCEGFRAEHEDQLVEMAQEAADEVRDSGDAKVLPQMNPSDRRIIHLALVNDPEVETVSQGRGYMKRVRIQALDDES